MKRPDGQKPSEGARAAKGMIGPNIEGLPHLSGISPSWERAGWTPEPPGLSPAVLLGHSHPRELERDLTSFNTADGVGKSGGFGPRHSKRMG